MQKILWNIWASDMYISFLEVAICTGSLQPSWLLLLYWPLTYSLYSSWSYLVPQAPLVQPSSFPSCLYCTSNVTGCSPLSCDRSLTHPFCLSACLSINYFENSNEWINVIVTIYRRQQDDINIRIYWKSRVFVIFSN